MKKHSKYHYSKNKHCKCGKLITNCAKKCPKCSQIGLIKKKGINKEDKNGNYKNGNCIKYPNCIECGKKLKNYRSKRCRKCANKKTSIINHHIYLKNNHIRTIKLAKNKHTLLHNKIYDYVYLTYGKKAIDKYIKWFDKKYGLL